MNSVLNGVLLLMLLLLLMAPLLLEVGLLLGMVMRMMMLAAATAAAVTLDCGGRVAVDGVLEALPRPAKVVLWHLIHAAAAADVASAAWLIHHPDATGVMLPLHWPRLSLLLLLLLGGGARVDLPQSSVKLQFRCKPEREKKRRVRLGGRGEWGKGKERRSLSCGRGESEMDGNSA